MCDKSKCVVHRLDWEKVYDRFNRILFDSYTRRDLKIIVLTTNSIMLDRSEDYRLDDQSAMDLELAARAGRKYEAMARDYLEMLYGRR